MHLSLSLPDIWYEALFPCTPRSPDSRVRPAGLDVEGFTLPGVPVCDRGTQRKGRLGRDQPGEPMSRICASEHLRGSGEGTEYQLGNGTWAPVLHHAEAIEVRGGRTVTADVLSTTHANGNG